jgi:hypothetical protein
MSDPSEAAPAPENQISMETLEEMKCPACGAQVDVRGLAAFSKIECPGCHAEARVPARFSHFTLLRRLGSGGMGTAFLGEDEALGRKVAVKVMQKALGDDEKAFETFKNEAQNAARLNHPHVAQIYSFGKEGDNPFLEMELVPGGDLGTFIADRVSLDPAFVLRVGMEIAEGLEAAEKVGLFHGDVKPDNILFDENMSAKLVDFGIASRASQGQMEELWGTPYYIAPEKVQKKMNSARSDIYSLGATLYHAITGKPPYDGEDAVAVIKARFKGPPPPVESIRPDVEPEVSRIITRMMYNDLFMRYPNYKSVIGDIEKYLSTVKDIRKQGPKGASATIRAKLTGTSAAKPESATGAAEAASSGTGKKKFVLSKGHMAAAAESGGSAPASGGGSHVVLKGHGGGKIVSASGAPGAQEQELDKDGKPKKKGKGLLITICVVVGVLVLGIGGIVWKVMHDKKMLRAAIARCVDEMNAVAAKLPGVVSDEENPSPLEAEAAKLSERMDKLVDDVNARLPEVDDVYGKATGGKFAWPDMTPPPRVEEPSPEELAAQEAAAASAEGGAEGGGDAAAAGAEKPAAAAAEKPAEPPAEEAPKPKRKTSAVDMLVKVLTDKMGYPIPADMIMQQAKAADMSADEYARAKLEELGIDLEEEGVAPAAPKPEAAAAPSFDAPAGGGMVGTVGRAGGHELDAVVEQRVVEPVRELQVQARDCYWLCGKVSEGVSFAPIPPESPLETYEAAVVERKRVYEERERLLQEAKECYAQANRKAQEMIQGIANVKKQAKKFINQREREKREAEEAEAERQREAAEQAEKERLAAVEAEEIARVQEVARSHLSLIDAFDYSGYQDKMHRMEKELTSPAALEELNWAIRRAECLKEYRQFLIQDIRRYGDVKKAYRGKDVRGISADGKRLLVNQMQDVKIASLELRDWIRLSWGVLENRAPDRPALDNIAKGSQLFNAAVFYYMHGKGDYASMERAKKLARQALELRGALRADAGRLIPPLAAEFGDAPASGGDAGGDGGAGFDE